MSVESLRQALRDVPDFPRKGILFKDVTPVVGNADLLRESIGLFVDRHRGSRIDYVAAVESRGFIFGSAVACALGAGFVPVRKKGKLPWRTIEATYDLEYGTATVEMHEDAVPRGARVLLLDDLLATGGTAAATIGLIQRLGGEVVEADFLVELAFLKGREKLAPLPVYAPIVF